jgi:hypothetical protein
MPRSHVWRCAALFNIVHAEFADALIEIRKSRRKSGFRRLFPNFYIEIR